MKAEIIAESHKELREKIIPLVDLRAQYDTIRDEIREAVAEVMESSAFIGGPHLAKFEESFALFCGVKHAAGVGSGTSALKLALEGLGVGPGDEVITVPNSFIATAEAISACGATPVFADIDPETDTIDTAQIKRMLTPRTRAVVPVHLYGRPADMDPIMELAREHGLRVVEDACQAHGALYKGRPVGALGHAACFSFYPGKNLGAYGEAGAVVTNDDELDMKIRVLRDHGQKQKYYHDVIGWNDRLDSIQAAVLNVKLKYLSAWNEARRQRAAWYTGRLSGCAATVPKEAPHSRHVYHIYAVGVPDRDECLKFMNARGVGCGVHYPVPIHLQKAYARLGLGEGSYPAAERRCREVISLPIYPELSAEQAQFVTATLLEFLHSRRGWNTGGAL